MGESKGCSVTTQPLRPWPRQRSEGVSRGHTQTLWRAPGSQQGLRGSKLKGAGETAEDRQWGEGEVTGLGTAPRGTAGSHSQGRGH